jgi:hypothetical protein
MGKILPFRRAGQARVRPATFRRPRRRRGPRRVLAVLAVLTLAAFAVWLTRPGAGAVIPAAAGPDDREAARFAPCGGPVQGTCVIDGDTIIYRGERIRLADLDAPEIREPACAEEAALGEQAKLRLAALLNAGPFRIEPNPSGRAVDNYGRSLRLVTRGGQSLGAVLIAEGLAGGGGWEKRDWCQSGVLGLLGAG